MDKQPFFEEKKNGEFSTPGIEPVPPQKKKKNTDGRIRTWGVRLFIGPSLKTGLDVSEELFQNIVFRNVKKKKSRRQELKWGGSIVYHSI